MPLLRLSEKLIYFSHIPKTGGTSIEAYMKTKGSIGFCSPDKLSGAFKTTPQHFQSEIASTLLPPQMLDAQFAVIRDPMTRLQSEYRWRGSKRGVVIQRNPPPHVQLLRKLHKGLGRRALDFDTWVRLTLDGFAKDPWIYDNHIRPQSEFVTKDHVLFAFEHGLDRPMRWIDSMTNTPPSPGDFWMKRTESETCDVRSETRRLVETMYHDDLELHARVVQAGPWEA